MLSPSRPQTHAGPHITALVVLTIVSVSTSVAWAKREDQIHEAFSRVSTSTLKVLAIDSDTGEALITQLGWPEERDIKSSVFGRCSGAWGASDGGMNIEVIADCPMTVSISVGSPGYESTIQSVDFKQYDNRKTVEVPLLKLAPEAVQTTGDN